MRHPREKAHAYGMPESDFLPGDIILPMWSSAFARILALVASNTHAAFALVIAYVRDEGYLVRFADLDAASLSVAVRAQLRNGAGSYEISGSRVSLPPVEAGEEAWSTFATALATGRHRLREFLHERGIKRRGAAGFAGPEWLEKGWRAA